MASDDADVMMNELFHVINKEDTQIGLDGRIFVN